MRLRRIVKWTLATLGTVVLLLVGVGFALFRTFYPSQPEADFSPTQDVATAQRQDFDYFNHYFDLNRTFTPAAEQEARKRLAVYALRRARSRRHSSTSPSLASSRSQTTNPAASG